MSDRTQAVVDAREDLFFAELAKTGVISWAAEVSGLDRKTAYTRKESKPGFADRWESALETYADTLEREAHRRAVAGTEKGIWHQGVKVGEEKQYSDSILLAMLKAKRRQYRDKVELGNADDKPFEVAESKTAVAREIAFALALGLRAKEQGNSQAVTPDDGLDMA